MTKEIFQGIFGGLLAVIICVGVGSLIASAMPHSDHSGDAHGDETHTEGSAHTNGEAHAEDGAKPAGEAKADDAKH